MLTFSGCLRKVKLFQLCSASTLALLAHETYLKLWAW